MVRAKPQVDIRDIFLGLQEEMHSKLVRNKKTLLHPVTKGDSSEAAWLNMLSSYLPMRYQATKAFVIDCTGRISHQIDVVIYDRHYSPFILRQDGATYIPAESVYAVIEVKPNLTKGNIEYAAQKAESVRVLKRTTAPIVHAGGQIKKPKKPFNLLAGILTIEGGLSTTFKNQLSNLSKMQFLNFGCSLKNGAFWFKTTRRGKCHFQTSQKNDILVFFFLNLLAALQQLGTVSAMNIDCYISAMKEHR